MLLRLYLTWPLAVATLTQSNTPSYLKYFCALVFLDTVHSWFSCYLTDCCHMANFSSFTHYLNMGVLGLFTVCLRGISSVLMPLVSSCGQRLTSLFQAWPLFPAPYLSLVLLPRGCSTSQETYPTPALPLMFPSLAVFSVAWARNLGLFLDSSCFLPFHI